jgi:hypothetical protein
MSTIVTRAGKGSALTHNEVDANFVNLNTDKLQSGNTAAALTITSATINGGTITGTALNGTLGATTPSTAVVTSITDSGLTSGRITFASTGGLLADSASLTYDGTTLTSTKFAGAFNGSLGATTPSTVVATTIGASGIISSSAVNGFLTNNGVSTSGKYISITNTGGTAQIGVESSAGGTQIVGSSAYMTAIAGQAGIGFSGNNGTTLHATIDTSGNLGLGVTPNTWYTNRKSVLSFGGSSSVATLNFAKGTCETLYNCYFNAAGSTIYQETNYAGYNDFNNTVAGGFAWKTAPSGTAGASGTLTTRMTLDASGNLLVGSGASSNTQLNVWLSSTTAYSATNIAGYRGIHVSNDGSAGFSNLVLNAVDATGAANCTTAINAISETSGSRNSALTFMTREHTTGNIVERARIDSGGTMLVGTTGNATTGGIAILPNANNSLVRIGHSSGSGNTAYYMNYYWNGNIVGSIQQSGTTGVTYVTSSDYRLKENVTPIVGALARVALLKPVTYSWIGTDGEVGEGFIAHELQEVCPLAAMGEKDAVNEDGTIKPQGIDPSKLVATLTAAIQEQQAMIDELKAKVAALEAA